MLVTFINNRDEEDSYGPYKIDHLPLPGELVGFSQPVRGGDLPAMIVYQVMSREYIFNVHQQPSATIFIEKSGS